MSNMKTIPIQNALKLPETKPESMVSEELPSRETWTTSFTCFDFGLVNILVNSGMIAAPTVPQLIMEESVIQRLWYSFPR